MSLRPKDLPKLRGQTVRLLDDPAASIRVNTGTQNQDGLNALTIHLRNGSLYWVSGDMSALAVSAGSQLAAAGWSVADRPAPCGLIIFEGGIGTIDSHGVRIPVEGYTWGTYQDCCLIWILLSRQRLAREVDGVYQLNIEQVPPLIPVYGFTIPIGDQPVPMVEVDPAVPQTVIGALAASWLLMQQPTLVDRTRKPPDRAIRRAYTRAGRPDPDVTLIDLCRQYVPDQPEDVGTSEGRSYRHRWVVSGHWRNQPYGPNWKQRRQQWIPSYVKGPHGAPMLSTERVNVWRSGAPLSVVKQHEGPVTLRRHQPDHAGTHADHDS